jgi:hypothetical protein
LAVAAVLAALGWAGHGDAVDERHQFALYCSHVFGPAPIWPDYQNVGRSACGELLQSSD